jgi:hypothetical protein
MIYSHGNIADGIFVGKFSASEDITYTTTTFASLDSAIYVGYQGCWMCVASADAWIALTGSNPATNKGFKFTAGQNIVLVGQAAMENFRAKTATGQGHIHAEYWD